MLMHARITESGPEGHQPAGGPGWSGSPVRLSVISKSPACSASRSIELRRWEKSAGCRWDQAWRVRMLACDVVEWLAARGESQPQARARDSSSDQGAEPQSYWSISRILQRRDGGKDPLSARSDFCHGLLDLSSRAIGERSRYGSRRYEMPRSRNPRGARCLDLGTLGYEMPRCRKLGYEMPRSRNPGYEMPRSRNRGSGRRCLHLGTSCLHLGIGAYI